MTATDELRRMLDERGVEWTYKDGTVRWRGERHQYRFSAWLGINNEVLTVSAVKVAPEQAIEGTLGRRECKVNGSIDYGEFGCWEYELSCGCRFLWPDNETPRFCPECGRKVVSV